MNDFLSLAKSRFSVRAYDERCVEEEKLEKIIEAGRVAPTARNNQPQKVYVVKSEEKRAALAGVTPCTFNAPVVFVVCYDETKAAEGKVYEGYSFGNTDAAIVCTHMMLEAADLGLGSCWVGWFNEKEVKDALGLPENIRVCDLLPVGYAADTAKPAPMHTSYRPCEETVEII